MNLILKDGAPTYRATVDLTGGGTVARYFISASYVNEGGMYETDRAMTDYNTNANYHRWNYRMNVDIDLTKSTLLKVGVSGSLDKQNLPGSQYHEIWHSLMGYSPIASPVQYSDGKWAAVGSEGRRNPWVLTTQQGYQETWKNKIQTTVNLEQDLKFITKGLKFYGRFGFDTYTDNGDNRFKWPESWLAERQRTSDGELQFRRIETQKLMDGTMYSSGQRKEYLEAELHYNRTFGDHMLGAVLKYSQDKTTNTSHNGNTDSYEKIVQSIQNRHQGFAGRFTYGWKYRYFFDFNFGYNGSENFAKGKRFGFFPAVALGWIVSSEKFMEPVSDVISNLKLRATWGKAGNSNIGGNRRFAYISTIVNTGSYRWGTDAEIYRLGRSEGEIGVNNLTWETVTKMNAGIDLGLWNGSVNLVVDVFKEKRDDIFMQRKNVPGSAGFNRPVWANYGKVENQGFDVSLNVNHKFNSDWAISAMANYTYAHNKVVEIDEPAAILGTYRSQTGKPIGQLFGLIAERLFTEDDFDENGMLKEGIPAQKFSDMSNLRPGDIKYKDLNGDGEVTAVDKTAIGGTRIPEIVYGFGATVSYKSFDLGVFFQGTGKTYQLLGGETWLPGSSLGAGNIYSNIDDRWTPENPRQDVFWPRMGDKAVANNEQASTWWLRDMSFLRLKNLELGYTLPQRWTTKIGIRGCRLFARGTNLLTFSNFKLWDPELETTDGLRYPQMKSVSVGFSINFNN